MGKKSSNKTTTESKSSNWLADNKEYANLVNNVISSSSNYQYTPQQIADMPQGMQDALNSMMGGRDLSGYEDAYNFMNQYGTNAMMNGQDTLNGAQGVLNKYQNMTQKDYEDMIAGSYNSDLVNEQIEGLKGDVQDSINSNVHSLDQSAAASGNMGSSRAGVAQGSIVAQGAKAIASGSLQYRTAEEAQAMNRVNSLMNTNLSAASSNASIGQNMINTGLGAFNNGMNYYNAGQNAQLQDWQNMVNAGSMLQNQQQNQMNIDRINQEAMQNPDLMRLLFINQGLGPIANYSTSGKQTTTTGGGGGGFGSMIGGTIGTAAGAYFGGGMGASLGGSMGSAMGSYF